MAAEYRPRQLNAPRRKLPDSNIPAAAPPQRGPQLKVIPQVKQAPQTRPPPLNERPVAGQPAQPTTPVRTPGIVYNDDFVDDVEHMQIEVMDPAELVRSYHANRQIESGKPIVTKGGRPVLRKIGDRAPLIEETSYTQIPGTVKKIINKTQLREFYVKSKDIDRDRIPTSIKNLGFHQMWDKYKGKGEVVAIIDGGVDKHPDLEGQIVRRLDFTPETTNVNFNTTHMAGLICANGNVLGVAPEAGIIDLVVVNSSGTVSDTTLMNALKWIIEYAKAGNTLTCVLIPLRCDADYRQEVLDMVEIIDKLGIIVISPISISVGAYDILNSIPLYSHNSGFDLNMYAPGNNSFSCVISGMYASVTGPGQAMAKVCGVICLLYQKLRAEGYKNPDGDSGKEALKEKIISLIIDEHTEVLGYDSVKDSVLRYVKEKDVDYSGRGVPSPVSNGVNTPSPRKSPDRERSSDDENDMVRLITNAIENHGN